MKANEAPERVYLSKNIFSTYLYQVPDPDDETAVEYVRTDAFIEKAVLYIQQHWIWNTKMIDDFRKYMKGE